MINKDVEISILLALVLCLDEQIHILKDQHKLDLKRKFNKLLKVSNQYEKEVKKSMEISGEYGIEAVYEALMDSISDAKNKAYETKD
jgi:hypothetical protein